MLGFRVSSLWVCKEKKAVKRSKGLVGRPIIMGYGVRQLALLPTTRAGRRRKEEYAVSKITRINLPFVSRFTEELKVS